MRTGNFYTQRRISVKLIDLQITANYTELKRRKSQNYHSGPYTCAHVRQNDAVRLGKNVGLAESNDNPAPIIAHYWIYDY